MSERYQERNRFSLQENTEAKLLETHLGITFREAPAKAGWTLSNRLRYSWFEASQNGCSPFGLSYSAGRIAVNLFTAAGFYDERLHTYFASDDVFSGLHENLHGYIHENNPALSNQEQTVAYLYQAARRKDPQMLNSENTTLNACLHEGIATWGAIIACEKMSPDQTRMVRMKNWLNTGREEDQRELPLNGDWIEENFAMLRQRIDFMNRAVNEGKIDLKELRLDTKKLEAKFIVGYYFINQVMSELIEKRGLTIEQALQAVILNPPSRLDEMIKAKEYLRQLKGKV